MFTSKMQQLVVVAMCATVFVVVEAYTTSTVPKSSFVVSRRTGGGGGSSSAGRGVGWSMDLENDSVDIATRRALEKILQEETGARVSSSVSASPPANLDEAQAVHGMPWKSSIDPAAELKEGEDLLYMPFWEWQVAFMKEHLTNLEIVSCSNGKTDFGYNENTAKKSRIVSICAKSAEYRKIRMTYYDAGDNTQVFNAVWYPDPKYNLPVLGIDLLAFNRKKFLAIVDFQPIHEKEEHHAQTFGNILEPIKEQYDSLKGKMSSKFYDETQFFSQQMLFARFEDEGVVTQELFPAFQQYVQEHLNLIRSTPPDESAVDHVMERQRAYDTYSAERDPAMGFFTAMFGQEWAMDFVHDFLFSMSERHTAAVPEQATAKEQQPAPRSSQPQHSSSPQPKKTAASRPQVAFAATR